MHVVIEIFTDITRETSTVLRSFGSKIIKKLRRLSKNYLVLKKRMYAVSLCGMVCNGLTEITTTLQGTRRNSRDINRVVYLLCEKEYLYLRMITSYKHRCQMFKAPDQI